MTCLCNMRNLIIRLRYIYILNESKWITEQLLYIIIIYVAYTQSIQLDHKTLIILEGFGNNIIPISYSIEGRHKHIYLDTRTFNDYKTNFV